MLADNVKCPVCTIERLHLDTLRRSERWALALIKDPSCDHLCLYSTLLLSLILRSHAPCYRLLEAHIH